MPRSSTKDHWDAYWHTHRDPHGTYDNDDRVLSPIIALGDLTGKRILEVGAGSGRDSIELARRGAAVTVIDYVPSSLSVVAANGRFFGGGMKVAPEADLEDDLLDILTVGDFGKLELLWVFPSIYRGTHISHSKVRMEKASRIRVSSEEPFLVHADGEVIGEGPACFFSRSRALSVVI